MLHCNLELNETYDACQNQLAIEILEGFVEKGEELDVNYRVALWRVFVEEEDGDTFCL